METLSKLEGTSSAEVKLRLDKPGGEIYGLFSTACGGSTQACERSMGNAQPSLRSACTKEKLNESKRSMEYAQAKEYLYNGTSNNENKRKANGGRTKGSHKRDNKISERLKSSNGDN